MYNDIFQNSQKFGVKKWTEQLSHNEAIIKFQNSDEIQSFFTNAMKDGTNCKTVHSIAESLSPAYCCRSLKSRPTPSEQDRLRNLYSEIAGGNAVVVLKNDQLKSTHPNNAPANDDGASPSEEYDILGWLKRQSNQLKKVFSKMVHSDYHILEKVYHFNENTSGWVPGTLDLSSVQDHSTGWTKWDDPFEVSALGAFKAAASYRAASFIGLSNSIKAAATIGSQTELVTAEYLVTGKSIVAKPWYGSYAMRYNIKTMSFEISWVKYKGSGAEERKLVEVKRKDRLMFVDKKIYNHPEVMIPPYRSMEQYLAEYKNGLVLPEHDSTKTIKIG